MLDLSKFPGVDPTGNTFCAEAINASISSCPHEHYFLPPGRYKLESPILHLIHQRGPGLRLSASPESVTFESHVANDFAIKVISDSGAFKQAAWGTHIEGISIVPGSGVLGAKGIQLRNAWHNVITGISTRDLATGVQLFGHSGGLDGGDNDSTAYTQFSHCEFLDGGVGVDVYSAPNQICHSNVEIRHCEVFGQEHTGVRAQGVFNLDIEHTGFALGGRVATAIGVYGDGISSKHINIKKNDIGNGWWLGVHIAHAVAGEITENSFSQSPNDPPSERAIYFGETWNSANGAKNFVGYRNNIRVDASKAPWQIMAAVANAHNCHLKDTWLHVYGAPGQVTFSNHGSSNCTFG